MLGGCSPAQQQRCPLSGFCDPHSIPPCRLRRPEPFWRMRGGCAWFQYWVCGRGPRGGVSWSPGCRDDPPSAWSLKWKFEVPSEWCFRSGKVNVCRHGRAYRGGSPTEGTPDRPIHRFQASKPVTVTEMRDHWATYINNKKNKLLDEPSRGILALQNLIWLGPYTLSGITHCYFSPCQQNNYKSWSWPGHYPYDVISVK